MTSGLDLAAALDALAGDLAAEPITIIGMNVAASGGAQGSTTTGIHIDMSNAVPNANGDTIGLNVTASYDGTNPNAALIAELREAAAAARKGEAGKGWVKSLLGRVDQLGMAALSAGVAAVTKAVLGLP